MRAGATVIMSLADESGGEEFEAGCLGSAEEVTEERVSDDDMVFIKGTATARCGPQRRTYTRASPNCP